MKKSEDGDAGSDSGRPSSAGSDKSAATSMAEGKVCGMGRKGGGA